MWTLVGYRGTPKNTCTVMTPVIVRDDATPRDAADERSVADARRASRRIASLVALNRIAALSTASLRERLREALVIGCDLLGLELGIVSEIRGDDYRVASQVAPGGLSDDQRFPLGQTYCAITLEADDVVSITDMGNSDYSGHPCYTAFKLESYIGAPILVRGELYGTVNFSSADHYRLGFDEGDREFIRLLASWAGAAIEREDQLASLRQAKLEADAANEAKSRFLAMMSHEIRTPLSGVLGTAQLLQAQGLDEPTRKRYAQRIVRAGNTLLALLNDILDLSRVEAGKLELNLSPFDPHALLLECSDLHAAVAERKAIDLRIPQCDVDRDLLGDATRLRQMLSNLLSNAIKHSRASRIEARAELLELLEIDERHVALVEFSVEDDGVGIPPEALDRLFHPFSQLNRTSTAGGSGLGLALVREFAEAMGGSVGLDSRPGVGSRFWFRVSMDVIPEIQRSLPPPVLLAPTETTTSGARILVVDDNAVNREILEAMLGHLGYACVLAENGREAINLLAATDNPPGLVLMDGMMPVMDGCDATREIRRRELASGGQHLPIIALTANVFDEEQRRFLAAGVDDVLTKPVDVATLRQALTKWTARVVGADGA